MGALICLFFSYFSTFAFGTERHRGLTNTRVSYTGAAMPNNAIKLPAALEKFVAPSTQTLESRGECREPIRRAIEDPRLQGLIKSRDNEDSQTKHDQSEPLLADLTGVQ